MPNQRVLNKYDKTKTQKQRDSLRKKEKKIYIYTKE